jgi:hypothetical protein
VTAAVIAIAVLLYPAAADQQINLADFGRVVKFDGDSPATFEVRELESGVDGWPVWTGPDGQSMIGVEWDQPRELAEVEIEFRHAIADRDRIRVQYFQPHPPTTQPSAGPSIDDPFHGQWVTAKADWWAGDRFVGFAFAPMNEESPGRGLPADATRKTRRLRFLLGVRKQELPAVRYLRAYGPARTVEAAFDIRLDRLSPLRSPLRATVLNGLLVESDGTTGHSTFLESEPLRLRTRFAAADTAGPNRTIVTLADDTNASISFSFLPAEAVERGVLQVPALGATIVCVGADKDLQAGGRPGRSIFDRLTTGPAPSLETALQEILGSGEKPPRPATAPAESAADYRLLLDQAMDLDLPDVTLTRFYQEELVKLLSAIDGRTTKSSPPSVQEFTRSAKPSPTCPHARALEYLGFSAINESFFDACVEAGSKAALAGRFGPTPHGLLAVPRPDEKTARETTSLEHAVLLTLFNEHYLLTGDRRWLARNAPSMTAACDLIAERPEADPEADTLAKEDEFWGRRLLPPGPIEGSPAWLWWLSANAYTARALRMTAASLDHVNDPAAVRITEQAAAFAEHLTQSCREAMRRAPVIRLADGQFVPHQPIRSRLRSRDPSWLLEAIHGPVHLLGCGIYAPDAPEASWILRDAEDNILPAVGLSPPDQPDGPLHRAAFVAGCAASPAGPPPLVSAYLNAGLHRHAGRAFYNLLAAHLAAIAPAADDRPPGNLGPTLLVWLRQLLVLERGSELDLLPGVPAEWLTRGRRIAVHRAPTAFGPLDLTVESAGDADRIHVRLDSPVRNGPTALRLWLRAPRPLLTVTCNGQRLATFEPVSGLVRIPVGTARAEIIVTY